MKYSLLLLLFTVGCAAKKHSAAIPVDAPHYTISFENHKCGEPCVKADVKRDAKDAKHFIIVCK